MNERMKTRSTPSRRSVHLAAAVALVAMLAALTVACGQPARAQGRNVIVLGMDGLDPVLVQQLIDEGRLPNFKRLADASGGVKPLETAATPQSPVAWSNFITGLDSGGHGIFDFLHRDLEDPLPFGLPYQATSRALPVGREIKVGGWIFPLSGGGIELARHGDAFWGLLQDGGVPSTVVRMPANFPPVGVGERELSGMGTPDLRGTSGEFTFFSTDRRQFMKRDISGGHIYPADVVDGVFEGTLEGLPDNPFTEEDNDAILADFTVYLDEASNAAKIAIGDQELVVAAGEWSEWVTADFELIPYVQSMTGAVRFYLKSIAPHFELYVTPIQIDPINPAMPIAEPLDFAAELAEVTGRYYTAEMPEDTKAIQWGVFDIDDFLTQTSLTRHETIDQYKYLLDTWQGGFLFNYFGTTDQVAHVMWGVTRDAGHPAYDPAIHDPYLDVIPQIYEEMDEVIGYTLDRIDDDTTLIVMSDHGFSSWRRAFHLNTWLIDHGYMAMTERASLPVNEFFTGVDWSRTQAYNIGLAGLYLNLRGREKQGTVAPGDRDELLLQLERDLLATVDPLTGEPAVTKVYLRERDFQDRGNIEIGPDIVVGFAKGVRGSGKSALGGIPENFLTDNTDDWSGDHIMDHRTVPGTLLSNRPLAREATSLQNLAAAILAEFGIEGFPDGSEPVTVVDED